MSPVRPAGTPRVIRSFKRRHQLGSAAAEDEHESLSSAFRRFLPRVVHSGDVVLDLGTGQGRAALLAARLARRVVGIDRDAAALEAARARVAARSQRHVHFELADLEQRGLLSRDLRRRLDCPGGFDAVLAHLCVSDRILKRASALVRPGGCVIATALHSDHWYETGRPSRFAYDERGLMRALRAAKLRPLEIEIETTETRFPSLEILRDFYLGGPRSERLAAWRRDGRWKGLQERFRIGRRTLTTSRITVLSERHRTTPGPRSGCQ